MTRPGAFVVIAGFEVPSHNLDAFMEAALDDARHALADEPGCRQFDVAVEEDVVSEGSAAVVFYEVYDDRAAFEAHLATAHLARFRDALALVAVERPPRFLVRRHP